MKYTTTIFAMVSAMALIAATAAATLAATTSIETLAKIAPNDNGCLSGEKDEDLPEKCSGTIVQDEGSDDPPDEDGD